MLCFVPLSKNIIHKIAENPPIISEIKHPKRGGKGTKWMNLVQHAKKKKPPTRVNNKRNMNKSSTQIAAPPPPPLPRLPQL
jgi:hypothetical protein